MNWFSGPIGNAIAESKTKQLIFLVYTCDGNSTEMSELWNDEAVSGVVTKQCVCLRLEADSEPCSQFKQIYPISCFPTTYLIGNNGVPLEVITGNVDKEVLLEKLQKAIVNFNAQKSASLPNIQSEPSASAEASAPTSSDDARAQSSAPLTESEQKSLDERVAIAKEKLRLIQEKKRAEEEEKEKNRELERRKTGQEILRAKQEREEQEAKRIADAKRKEKLEDEQAKQRIRERIQQDREEKQKKYAQDKEEVEKAKEAVRAQQELAKQKEQMSDAANKSQVARLQFRLIDGSSIVRQFDPEQKLADARQFIADKLKEMNESSSFSMHSTFPKRDYTSEDMELTLRELHLAPSACLLIIPVRSKAAKTLSNLMPAGVSSRDGSSSSVVSYASDLLGFIFLPLTIIWGVITSFIGIGGASGGSGVRADTAPSTSGQAGQQEPINNLRRRNQGVPGTNVRGLHDRNKDDDENATWNGNSTQQM